MTRRGFVAVTGPSPATLIPVSLSRISSAGPPTSDTTTGTPDASSASPYLRQSPGSHQTIVPTLVDV